MKNFICGVSVFAALGFMVYGIVLTTITVMASGDLKTADCLNAAMLLLLVATVCGRRKDETKIVIEKVQ